ncbi:MAG: DUF4351 domain-containing protein [Richelia sp. SM1_7_0]|nr:DUF4351 domain-containing protein [Richelia sp. SM1_7_0]
MLLLTLRLGEIDTLSLEQIRGLSIEQLTLLVKALLDFSDITDLEAWLNK